MFKVVAVLLTIAFGLLIVADLTEIGRAYMVDVGDYVVDVRIIIHVPAFLICAIATIYFFKPPRPAPSNG